MIWFRHQRRASRAASSEARKSQEVFNRLVRDLSLEDMSYLLDLPMLRERIYIFNEQTRSVSHPTENQVPWPILFGLGRYSAKHRFCNHVPRASEFSKAVQSTVNRIHWKYHFFSNPEGEGLGDLGVPTHQLLEKRGHTPYCTQEVPVELRIFTTELKHRLMKQFNKSVQQYRFHSFWRNRPGILRVCNQLLERRR